MPLFIILSLLLFYFFILHDDEVIEVGWLGRVFLNILPAGSTVTFTETRSEVPRLDPLCVALIACNHTSHLISVQGPSIIVWVVPSLASLRLVFDKSLINGIVDNFTTEPRWLLFSNSGLLVQFRSPRTWTGV